MEATITREGDFIIEAEYDGRRYRLDLYSAVPGWGVWKPVGRDDTKVRDWMTIVRALDKAWHDRKNKR